MPFARFLLCSPPRCLMKMVASPAAAITSMAKNPASFPRAMEKTMNPTKDTPMATAASVRKRPRMPMNSNGFWSPLNTGKPS